MTGAIISGVLAAFLLDLHIFIRERRKDKTTKFDWPLAGARITAGAIAGILAGSATGYYV